MGDQVKNVEVVIKKDREDQQTESIDEISADIREQAISVEVFIEKDKKLNIMNMLKQLM